MSLKRIIDGGLGAEPPASGDYGGLGAKPPELCDFLEKIPILVPLDCISHVL